eukprot:TRINITY_DN596_c0_g1_i1.p1 TRINITY_DN596_c0_g1~~TRINITY_DN596_c0_g1_i1.p1  ORF type:complete len:162 (-),score=42.35 TRINITY_DN596_c0_g1_i1:147-632(-)
MSSADNNGSLFSRVYDTVSSWVPAHQPTSRQTNTPHFASLEQQVALDYAEDVDDSVPTLTGETTNSKRHAQEEKLFPFATTHSHAEFPVPAPLPTVNTVYFEETEAMPRIKFDTRDLDTVPSGLPVGTPSDEVIEAKLKNKKFFPVVDYSREMPSSGAGSV